MKILEERLTQVEHRVSQFLQVGIEEKVEQMVRVEEFGKVVEGLKGWEAKVEDFEVMQRETYKNLTEILANKVEKDAHEHGVKLIEYNARSIKLMEK